MLNILFCRGALCLPGSEERVLPFRSRFQPPLNVHTEKHAAHVFKMYLFENLFLSLF